MKTKNKQDFNGLITYQNLLFAHYRARKHKRFRPEVLRFEENLYFNLLFLLDSLKNQTYQSNHYRKFWIQDPKKRLIYALPYQDRIVHQLIVESFLKPIFLPKFIATSYACLENRGAHKACYKVQSYLYSATTVYGNTNYILKLDIAKFFYHLDKNILFKILSRQIKNKQLLSLLNTIIFDKSPEDGIPIGNYTSQIFANIYMNELDQFAKRQLNIRYYIRYMDDIFIIAPDKQTAKHLYQQIENFLSIRLKLSLNPKSCYFPAQRPVDFCGYIITKNRIDIRKRSRKSIHRIIKDYETGKINQNKFIERVNAWLGHALHADTMHYTKRTLIKYLDLFPRLNYKKTTPEQSKKQL